MLLALGGPAVQNSHVGQTCFKLYMTKNQTNLKKKPKPWSLNSGRLEFGSLL